MSGFLNKLFGGDEKREAIPDDAIRPVSVTDEEFETVVLGSKVPVIVDFWAPWCMPCRMLAPTLERIAAEYGEDVLVAKVNTDEDSQWATRYGVRGIPTMLFIWKGHEAGRIVGVVPESAIKQQLQQMLA
jgi:thioredoxin 1